MQTSLKTGFAQIFSSCPKKLSCPKFGGAAAPLAPLASTPMHKAEREAQVDGSYYPSKLTEEPIGIPN